MKIEIHGLAEPAAPELVDHLNRRVQFAIGRFGPRIRRIQVRLDDVNGPKGGRDKLCHVLVQTREAGNVVIEEIADDFFAATARAADRLGRSIRRKLERKRDAWHGRIAARRRTAS